MTRVAEEMEKETGREMERRRERLEHEAESVDYSALGASKEE